MAAAAMLIWCTGTLQRRTARPLFLRALDSAVAVKAGEFSYSIYLIHYPFLLLLWNLMMLVPIGSVARALVMYGVCFPLLLGCSFLFHLAFERRFMPGHLQRKRMQAAASS